MIPDKDFPDGLTEDQRQALEQSGSAEEVFALAKEYGIELSDEQLESVVGGIGGWGQKRKCSKCGSTKVVVKGPQMAPYFHCKNCGHEWTTG